MLPYCLLFGLLWIADVAPSPLVDLAYGNAQMEQFMRDRPDSASVIRRNDALHCFFVRNFAGLDRGRRIQWDRRDMKDPAPSVFGLGDEEGLLDRIRVTNTPGSGVDMCLALALEIENARSYKRLRAIFSLVARGQMSRNDFARSVAHLEFQSYCRNRDFFREHPLRDATLSKRYKGVMAIPDEFDEHVTQCLAADKNFFEFYAGAYDRFVGLDNSAQYNPESR